MTETTTKTLWEWECDWLLFLDEIKHNGIKINRPFCNEQSRKGKEILASIRKDLGWNPASTKQLASFLLDTMKYPVLARTPKGAPSFNKKAMEEYDELLALDGSEVAKQVIRYRGWQKTVTSNYDAYLKLADRDDILRPGYKAHGTVNGRPSCEKPNLLQIPRESENEWNGDLKKGFIPRSDDLVLMEFDYKQIEFRLQAAVAEEQELLDAFNSGVDVFEVMAKRLGWKRQDCKLLVYMTSYGAGPKKVALVFGLTVPEGEKMINDFFGEYPGLSYMATQATDIVKTQGYIEFWTGRRRHIRDKRDYHKAFNSYSQGGAFEIVKRQGLRLRELVPYPFVLTVYDSYVLEMPKSAATAEELNRIKGILEDVPEAPEMGVKFDVDVGVWGEK